MGSRKGGAGRGIDDGDIGAGEGGDAKTRDAAVEEADEVVAALHSVETETDDGITIESVAVVFLRESAGVAAEEAEGAVEEIGIPPGIEGGTFVIGHDADLRPAGLKVGIGPEPLEGIESDAARAELARERVDDARAAAIVDAVIGGSRRIEEIVEALEGNEVGGVEFPDGDGGLEIGHFGQRRTLLGRSGVGGADAETSQKGEGQTGGERFGNERGRAEQHAPKAPDGRI